MGSLAVLYQRIPLFRLSRALTCGLQTLSSGSVVNSFAAFPLPLRNAWIADLHQNFATAVKLLSSYTKVDMTDAIMKLHHQYSMHTQNLQETN